MGVHIDGGLTSITPTLQEVLGSLAPVDLEKLDLNGLSLEILVAALVFESVSVMTLHPLVLSGHNIMVSQVNRHKSSNHWLFSIFRRANTN